MVNQHGKAFEDKLRRVAKSLGWYVLRLPTPSTYYALRMPADFVVFTPKVTLLIECKATKHDKYKPKDMRQYDKFKEFATYKTQGQAVVIVDFIDEFSTHSYCYTDADHLDDVVLTAGSGSPDLKGLLTHIEQEVWFLCK